MVKQVRVFAPASVANVAVGYDLLGFALEFPGDEIVARYSDHPGVRILGIEGDGGRLPTAIDQNTAGYAAQRLWQKLDRPDLGIDLFIHKKMPFGSGLGSSAASAAAAVMAVNGLLGCPLTKRECLRSAVEGEQVADGAFHADNVAPSLFGGFTLNRCNDTLDVLSLPVPEGLCAAVVHPDIQVLTKDARGILRQQVGLDQCIQQMGNLGAFIAALYRSDYELIARSLQDVIIEPQRAPMIPHFRQVQQAALRTGALGCSISGAGPSVFALCQSLEQAQACGSAMRYIFTAEGIPCDLFVSPINQQGAILLDQSERS